MRLGGAFSRNRISLSCIAILGVTLGAGIANIEIKNNSFSNAFQSIGNLFKGEEGKSKSPSEPFDPFKTISLTSSWLWQEALSKVFSFISDSYEWIKEKENSNTVVSFFKNFWNFEILKQILFNFPWTVFAWIKIFMEKGMVYKFPLVLKRSSTLAVMLISQKENQELLKMINWLFIRLLVNPRKTLNIFSRPLSGKKLMCNGGQGSKGPRGGTTKWLGVCFFEGNGKVPPKPNGLKLKEDIKHFLETGENLKDKKHKPK